MTHRKRWHPIPSVLYGIAFGILAGGLMIWATDQDDRWQDQASTLLEISMITMLACATVSYVRQFMLN
jgi:hypothetical protein